MLTAMLIGLCAVVVITACAALLIYLSKRCVHVYKTEKLVEWVNTDYTPKKIVGMSYHLKCTKCGCMKFTDYTC